MPMIMKSLNAISRAQAQFRAECAVSDELAACHWVFLFTVNRLPGLTQEELARELFLNKSTVARALTSLEEHGFVERKSDSSDKRVLLVYPTEKTKGLIPELRVASREWNELISSGIDEGEMEIFLSVLRKMECNAKEAISIERREACKK